MDRSWLFFLFLVVISLFVQGFYSMMEMASLSFNRVRLQYFVSKKDRRAIWLKKLLDHPIRLFGTTLIGVNAAMQFGSESARRLYLSLGLNPDWSFFSQVFIVLVFAELAPMFAARRYAGRVGMMGVPLLYLTSVILSPLIYALDLLCRIVHWIFGTPFLASYLSREELQKAIEGREEMSTTQTAVHHNPILTKLFTLTTKTASDMMTPLMEFTLLPATENVGSLRSSLQMKQMSFVLLYHHSPANVVAVAHLRDLVHLDDSALVRLHARSPWFISEKSPALHMIREFKENRQNVAVILDDHGEATGIVTLDDLFDEVFGERNGWKKGKKIEVQRPCIAIERSFPGETRVADLNRLLEISLGDGREETLEEMMFRYLGHRPERGEVIRDGGFELIVEETSMIAGKTILVRSLSC